MSVVSTFIFMSSSELPLYISTPSKVEPWVKLCETTGGASRYTTSVRSTIENECMFVYELSKLSWLYRDSINQWSRDYKDEQFECSNELPPRPSKYTYKRDGDSMNLWDEDEVYNEGAYEQWEIMKNQISLMFELYQ
ncbi:hypothetical protein PVK06_005321 [Gossypium arboreum]|uniref:Uncharacterized protein n=1 Tax=Gossypium arboreum TaxID=29729 RepID=A0ABR0QVL0_GOSAR|nr:hypothetical protein PVK06_005321 [Gossypium arboreum]